MSKCAIFVVLALQLLALAEVRDASLAVTLSRMKKMYLDQQAQQQERAFKPMQLELSPESGTFSFYHLLVHLPLSSG